MTSDMVSFCDHHKTWRSQKLWSALAKARADFLNDEVNIFFLFTIKDFTIKQQFVPSALSEAYPNIVDCVCSEEACRKKCNQPTSQPESEPTHQPSQPASPSNPACLQAKKPAYPQPASQPDSQSSLPCPATDNPTLSPAVSVWGLRGAASDRVEEEEGKRGGPDLV